MGVRWNDGRRFEGRVAVVTGGGGTLGGAQVDVIGAMRMCHAVRPMMLEAGGGAMVNFSSTYGNGTNPENAINFVPVTYSTAKGAVRGFTTTLARDLAPEIRVNALAPGPISGEWETEWGVAPEHIARRSP